MGTRTVLMKHERLKQLMLNRVLDRTWDSLSAQGYALEDLDQEEILKTVEQGVACGRLKHTVIPKNNVFEILMGLGLIENGSITNAAVVLFSKKISSLYSQCELKMARFMGITKSKGFLDEKRYLGNAFEILEEGEAFVRRHLNIRMELLEDSFKRVDTPQLPFLAIREALINAICHRNYLNQAGSISLAIYDDRLELWNLGELLSPLYFEDLKKTPHESIPRNKKIAHVFYVREFIEKWGSGTTRMLDLCKDKDCLNLNILNIPVGFVLVSHFKRVLLKKKQLLLSMYHHGKLK
jgi:ATP-dependent DNA helicase RecG